ncbi:FIST C-terminal domain-containing protein [Algoriphagus machipongonensis]|uniref:FIST domain-containing protein n=1 Tax=Algoriphagus machipongonensis TaxID=388413 RepID=A3HVA0_9BACT|nr:FIST C-terminal domain-containing protein [Algoriphagus machipongonensis]EAZ82072.1 hypothetical protein ALPR1_02485 [Algoriphagus machipongonensis]
MSAKATSFGVGFAETTDSLLAGVEASKQALQTAGLFPEEVQLCFLFCTSRHEAEHFFEGVKSCLGEQTQYFGGFSNGACTNTELGYDGYQAIVGLLGKGDFKFDLMIQEGIGFHEFETGKSLGLKIQAQKYDSEPQMFLLFDAVNRLEGRFRMNYGTPFIKGMSESIQKWPNTIGARMLGDMKFKPTRQWCGQSMSQNAAMALLMHGNIKMDSQIMHGCQPASAYHKVTAVKGANILELDHKPALEVVGKILGPDLMERPQELKFFVTLGKNVGDKWEAFNPGNYINRMCVGVDTQGKGIYMAEMDIETGMEVQLMRRSFEMEYVSVRTKKLIQRVKSQNRRIIFGLYINCSGRAAAYSNHTDEDVRYVQEAIDGEFPLMGIYEAGELAMIGEKLQVLDWTGLFCIFSEEIN